MSSQFRSVVDTIVRSAATKSRSGLGHCPRALVQDTPFAERNGSGGSKIGKRNNLEGSAPSFRQIEANRRPCAESKLGPRPKQASRRALQCRQIAMAILERAEERHVQAEFMIIVSPLILMTLA